MFGKLLSFVLAATASATQVFRGEDKAIDLSNVTTNEFVNSTLLTQLENQKETKGTLVHWYSKLAITNVRNFLADTTGLLQGCSSNTGSSWWSQSSVSASSCSGNPMTSSCSSKGRGYSCVHSGGGCVCESRRMFESFFFHPDWF